MQKIMFLSWIFILKVYLVNEIQQSDVSFDQDFIC